MTSLLKLGDFEFQDFEIPEQLNAIGGTQAIRKHRLVGGKNALDVMGPDDEPIRWRGKLRGPDALDRANILNRMWRGGLEYALTWETLAFTVVIGEFLFTPETAREVPYSITCEVVRDDTAAAPELVQQSTSSVVMGDINAASEKAAAGGFASLVTQIGKVSTIVTDVTRAAGDLGLAPRGDLQRILVPLYGAQQITSDLIRLNETTTISPGGVGGVLPGMRGLEAAANLTAQFSAFTQGAALYEIDALLGRVDTNVSSVIFAGATAVTVAADLFTAARDAYGDASEWATLARANDVTDPQLSGLQEIVIPPTPLKTGGVPR